MISYIIFILYMLLLFGIGLYFYKKTHNSHDFVLGGRSLGAFPSALSAVSSDFSVWLLMGLPGFALLKGMGAFWISLGLLFGIFANWHIVAPRLRKESVLLNDAITVPTFLERKLGDPTHFLRVTLSLAILFFFSFYTASGFVAGGKLFSVLFHIDYHIALIVGALIVLSYTLLGGYLAVSWTDVVQGILMLIAILYTPLAIINSLGGWQATYTKLVEISPYHLNIWYDAMGNKLTLVSIISFMAWGLGYFGQPHILSRMMGIKSVEKVAPAKWIATAWSGVAMSFALIVGCIGVVYFSDKPLQEAEHVFIMMIQNLDSPLLGGLFLAAIMAAIMSTADSQLLVASSALTNDLIRDNTSERLSLILGRATVSMITLVALFLAWNEQSNILSIVGYAWAGLGASIGSVMLCSLLWKKTSYQGGIAGVFVGAITTVIWHNNTGGIFDIYELLPAFIFALIAIVVTSLLTKRTN